MIDPETLTTNEGGNVTVRPRVADVLEVVADLYQLRVEDLRSQQRPRRIAWPRQLACAVASEITGKSYPQIGRVLRRDHTTILFAHHKLRRLRAKKQSLDVLMRRVAERALERAASRPKPQGGAS